MNLYFKHLKESFFLQLDLKSHLFDKNQSSEESQSSRKQTFKEKVETKAGFIMNNINDLNALKKKLRKDYQPLVVIQNLNQTIKDLEVILVFISL